MCEGSNLSAEIEYSKIPLLKNLSYYASKMIYPDITFRNWKSYENKVQGIGTESLLTLCDPQTSGGLLTAVEASYEQDFLAITKKAGMSLLNFGTLKPKNNFSVIIQ
jgi:selenide,water dikinase